MRTSSFSPRLFNSSAISAVISWCGRSGSMRTSKLPRSRSPSRRAISATSLSGSCNGSRPLSGRNVWLPIRMARRRGMRALPFQGGYGGFDGGVQVGGGDVPGVNLDLPGRLQLDAQGAVFREDGLHALDKGSDGIAPFPGDLPAGWRRLAEAVLQQRDSQVAREISQHLVR